MTTIDSTRQLVDLINSETGRFKELVSALPPDALEKQSPCELWNVGEVIAHLIWFAEKYGGMMERGVQGDQSPPDGFPAVPGTMQGSAISKFYGDSAVELHQSLGEQLIPEFCERYDWLNDLVKNMGPDDWNKPCYHTLRVRPVESFVPVIFSELAVHSWDIRSTVEPASHLSEESIPALMAKLPSSRRPWSAQFPTEATSPGLKRFRFKFTDFEDGRDIIAEGGKTRIETLGEALADLTLTSSASTFLLLMYGRHAVGSALAAGLIAAEGDLGLILAFDRWLEGD